MADDQLPQQPAEPAPPELPVVSADGQTIHWQGRTYALPPTQAPSAPPPPARKFDRDDIQGVITLLSIVGAIALQGMLIYTEYQGDVAPVPSWLSGIAMAAIGYYLGTTKSRDDK